MNRFRCYFGLAVCLFFISGVQAQHTKSLVLQAFTEKQGGPVRIVTDFPTTGVVVILNPNDSFEGSFLLCEGDTIWLREDEDTSPGSGKHFSNMHTFRAPVSQLEFYMGRIRGQVEFIFIDARLPEGFVVLPSAKAVYPCTEPYTIDQEEWRAGLPYPDYQRIPNEVHNLIIHHTAGSNTDDNYIQVIRNIYIYHTEVRGWSDIGYNYVIAQDGTIFKGRDPGELEQDNTLGAHFCGANTGTMGISMMGTYTDILPPDTALQSLILLLNWKAGKDSLDPSGYNPHLLNPFLPVIAGHRDGCATECPGTLLYEYLNAIRDTSQQAFNACGYYANPPLSLPHVQPEYSLRQEGHVLQIRSVEKLHVRLFTLHGQELSCRIREDSPGEMQVILPEGIPGLVIIQVRNDQGASSQLILLNAP